MPTQKQLKAAEKMVENGGNVSRAMEDAGYSPATAHTPSKLTESKGFTTIVEDLQRELGSAHITAKKLASVIKQGLGAKQLGKMVVIEKAEGEDTVVTKKTYQTPDHMIRHKFLDTALKVLGGYPQEDKTPTSLILMQFKTLANAYVEPDGDVPDAEQETPDAEASHADAQEAEVVHAD